MILNNDGEPSITALVTAVQKEWAGDSKNFQTQLIPCTSPVDDHASNGAAEEMVHSLEGLTRTSKVALEESLGVSISSKSPILPLVRDQSFLRNRVACTPIKTRVFAVPPEEFQNPIPGGVWEMTETVHGLEGAAADFHEHFGLV